MRHAYKIYAHFSDDDYHPQQGTGFFVKSPKGDYYFLTNAHVATQKGLSLHSANICHFKDGKMQGCAVGHHIDHKHDESSNTITIEGSKDQLYLCIYQDIAVLKVDTLSANFEMHALDFSTAEYNASARVTGFPQGVIQSIQGLYYGNELQGHVVGNKSFDCGSSGSPVLNKQGQVIAIHHRGRTDIPLYLKILPLPKQKDIYVLKNSPCEIDNPMISVCMPTAQIISFLKSSPYINW